MNVLNKIKSKKNTPTLSEQHSDTSGILNKTSATHQRQDIKQEISKQKISKISLQGQDENKSFTLSKQNGGEIKRQQSFQLKVKETFPDIFSNRDSDFSEDSFNRIDSFSKVLKIQRKSNLTHQQNKKISGTGLGKNSENQIMQKKISKVKPQQAPKQYSELLFVKKGYQIGRMSVFEGVLEHKKYEKGLNVQIRIKQTQIKKFSCKADLIPNPESISQIYLNKILEIGDQEYLIGEKDILKAVQKPNSQNQRYPVKFN